MRSDVYPAIACDRDNPEERARAARVENVSCLSPATARRGSQTHTDSGNGAASSRFEAVRDLGSQFRGGH